MDDISIHTAVLDDDRWAFISPLLPDRRRRQPGRSSDPPCSAADYADARDALNRHTRTRRSPPLPRLGNPSMTHTTVRKGTRLTGPPPAMSRDTAAVVSDYARVLGDVIRGHRQTRKWTRSRTARSRKSVAR